MAREDWFPKTLDGQQNHFMNVKDKIPFYEAPLAMDITEVGRITEICTEVLAVIEHAREAKSTLQSLTDWRNLVLEGPGSGPATVPPEFTQMPILTGLKFGLYDEYKNMVAKEKLKAQFTTAIGEDLGWLGAEKPEQIIGDITPAMEFAARPGYEVTVKGKMQGMDGLRIEYRRNGTTDWKNIAFLTSTPGSFIFTPDTPGQPETGDFRCIFIKKNVPVGLPSGLTTLTAYP